MVEDLSMHIADLLENSFRAGAKHVELRLSLLRGTLRLEVDDDGSGMDGDLLRKAADPFFTTKRHGKRIGLGLPLFLQTVEELGGTLEVSTRPGGGTRVRAEIPWHHPDRPPLGDLAETVVPIILTSPGVEFRIVLEGNGERIELDTERLKEELGISCLTPEAMGPLMRMVREAMDRVGLKEGA
ncbi:ATP-binding protein [Candidatus Acetothermia bacterium]|nr:MAG: ATP-binding protein [Candidatus Acetothermia bacterium]